MKITCDIIRDVLPLYAENLASGDTRQMVEDHVCGCEECRKELDLLRKDAPLPENVGVSALKKVKRGIALRRVLAVSAVLLVVFSLYVGVGLMMDATVYLTAEQAVQSVVALPDGSIRVYWSSLPTKIIMLGNGNEMADEPTGNYGIIAATNLRKLLLTPKATPYEELPGEVRELMPQEDYGTSTIQLEGKAANQNVWYCSAKDGTGEKLLWDAGNDYAGGTFVRVNYHLGWYCAALAGLAVFFSGWPFLLKDRRQRSAARHLASLFGCICASTAIVCGGQFMEISGEFAESLLEGLIVAAPLFAGVVCGMKLRQLAGMDRET